MDLIEKWGSLGILTNDDGSYQFNPMIIQFIRVFPFHALCGHHRGKHHPQSRSLTIGGPAKKHNPNNPPVKNECRLDELQLVWNMLHHALPSGSLRSWKWPSRNDMSFPTDSMVFFNGYQYVTVYQGVYHVYVFIKHH